MLEKQLEHWGSGYIAADAEVIIEFGVQRQRWEGMKGYESCYDCEYETQEEGAGKHSKKITNRDEEGRGVEGVSCIHLAIGGDATGRQIDTT